MHPPRTNEFLLVVGRICDRQNRQDPHGMTPNRPNSRLLPHGKCDQGGSYGPRLVAEGILEVVLAHRARQRVDAARWHGVLLPQLPPTQMKPFLVPVDVVEKERQPFPAPVGVCQRPPAAGFVEITWPDSISGSSRYEILPNTRHAARSRDSLCESADPSCLGRFCHRAD